MSNHAPAAPAPAPAPANRSPLNVEAKLFVPGVGMVTPPPKRTSSNSHKNEEEEEDDDDEQKKKAVEVSPLNWDVVDEREGAEQPTTPNDSRNSESTVPFIPARGPVKKRVDDPFDKEIYLQSSVQLVKEEFKEKEEKAETKKTKKKKRRKKKSETKITNENEKGEGEDEREDNSGSSMPLLSPFPIQSPPTLVEVVPASSDDDDEEQTPRESKMLSKPLLCNKKIDEEKELLVNEYDTRQLQEVENLFPEESRVPLLAVSAEKKGEEQYGANEEEDIPDEKLWTKETLAPLLGGDLNSIKTLNTRRREEDGEKLVTGAKLTFTNYGADENVVADWGDAKVPLLSASAGNTPRYLDGGVLLSRHGPFSYGTAGTDEVEESVASSSSDGYVSSSSSDDDAKENRLHSAKLLLEQFLMSEKKQTKTPISVDLQQNGPNNIGSMRQTTHSIQFKPLLKTPPRLKKIAHTTILRQRCQTTQTIREQRRPSISSPYTPLMTHSAEQTKNALRDDLCCVFHAVLVSRPEILEKHLALSSASPSSSLRSRVASLEPRRSTRRRLDRFEANLESFMVFAVGDEECKRQQLVTFDAFARAMRVAATAAARMTTVEGVRDAVDILSDFESLFTRNSMYSSIVHEYLTSTTNTDDQIFRHQCSRRLRAYKSIISILNKIKRYDETQSFNVIAAKESNITADRVCLLIAALDYPRNESESQEDYSTTHEEEDVHYLFSLVSSAKRKLAAEIDDTSYHTLDNGYDSRYNSNRSNSMPLSEVIARRRQMVDAWFETQRF